MSIEIKVPSAGESVTSGLLASWLKDDGAAVAEGEELFELETDKATLAVPSPAAGTLKRHVTAGTEVAVGSIVGEIMETGAAAKPAEKPAPVAASQARAAPLSPAVRRIVEEGRLDATAISGSGKDGRITKEDALRAADTASAPKPPPAASGVPPASPLTPTATYGASSSGKPGPGGLVGDRQTRVPMTTIRRRIAERLVAAKQASAHLTTFNEVDMSRVAGLRSQYRESFEAKHGVKLGFMSFFVAAAVEALKEFPLVNATVDGEDIVYNNFYDVGVAVASERGLVVPVIRDADRLTLAQIEGRILDLAKRARDKKLTVDEISGGTFTITNGGVFGSLLSTPIPNYPQSAILGMHTIQKRPVAVDDQVVVRPMMYVALTYDHRIIDGQGAVSFLVRIKQLVESPERLLLQV